MAKIRLIPEIKPLPDHSERIRVTHGQVNSPKNQLPPPPPPKDKKK
jgi:hypothetical protein